MQLAKIQVKDIEKLITEIRKSPRAAYINVSTDGPVIKFSFENDSGRLVTVSLWDESRGLAPTLTESRSL